MVKPPSFGADRENQPTHIIRKGDTGGLRFLYHLHMKFDDGGNRLPGGYQVRVKGCLGEAFLAWLDLSGSYDPQADETLLLVATSDQAALYGVLNRLRDLGLTLLSVTSQPGQNS